MKSLLSCVGQRLPAALGEIEVPEPDGADQAEHARPHEHVAAGPGPLLGRREHQRAEPAAALVGDAVEREELGLEAWKSDESSQSERDCKHHNQREIASTNQHPSSTSTW